MLNEKKIKDKHEEYLKKLENVDEYSWDTYESLSRKISILLQFVEIIDKHREELEESLKIVLNKYNIRPSSLLLDYIAHEIQSFYRLAWKNKDKIGITQNDFPDYQKEKLKKFRDKITGHFEDITIKETVELYRMINEVGFERILKDYLKFRDLIIKKFKEKNNP